MLVLERKQTGLNAEIIAAQEQLRSAHDTDRERLAAWVVDRQGDRPLPLLPGIERRIVDLEQERDALTTATERVLDEKERFVAKHRSRLVREASKARARAIERLEQTISACEEARAEAVDCVAAQRWAAEYPAESADASSLRVGFMKGGRLTTCLPEFRGLAVAGHVRFRRLHHPEAYRAKRRPIDGRVRARRRGPAGVEALHESFARRLVGRTLITGKSTSSINHGLGMDQARFVPDD
ncbi:MAG: hypothetical protein H0W90_13530 [Actinobacteria bacterium]|nr:hypothetical protein [Actinomycetota bacterium]